MGWTKRQFVDAAFEELGLAPYVYDLTNEQRQGALYRLDAMMATWNGKTIRVGYPLPSSPQDSTLDTETNVPDSANEAIYTNLAVRIGPLYGKVVPPETKAIAKAAYDVLAMKAAMPDEMEFPNTLPMGAGNKPIRQDRQYLPGPQPNIDAGPDGAIEFD